MTIVYLGGVFDLFHIGHLRILKRAKKLGDVLVVGVMTDESAEAWKRKPIIPLKERIEIVQEFADIVIPINSQDATYLHEIIKPDVVVRGSDDYCKEQKWVAENHKRLVIFPYTEEQSTSKIINVIRGKNKVPKRGKKDTGCKQCEILA